MYKARPVMFLLLLLFVFCVACEKTEPENLLSQIYKAEIANFEKFKQYDSQLLHDIIPFDAKYEYDFKANSNSFRCTATRKLDEFRIDTWSIDHTGKIKHFIEKIKE